MLYATTFKYAGFEMEAATNEEKEYFISQATSERLYDWRANSTREKLAAKSFKSFLGEGFQVGKISDNSNHSNSKKTWLSTPTFLALNAWEAQNGNRKATAILLAGFTADFMATLKAHFGDVMSEDEKEYLRTLGDVRQAQPAISV